jgi:TonB family protein
VRKHWLAVCLACTAAWPAAGQDQTVPDLIAAARALASSQQLDSAVVLLRRAIDPGTGGTIGQRAQALVLLGIVRYYEGQDSLTASAFRAAITLDTTLRVGGLSEIDPSLGRVFEAERAMVVAETAARFAAQSVNFCVPHCLNGVVAPTLRDIPHFVVLDSGPDFINTHAVVVVRMVVSADGAPEPETIRVASSTMRSVDNQVLDVVRAAHFQPARAHGVPVRALVELSFDFRAEGMNGVTYRIRGP